MKVHKFVIQTAIPPIFVQDVSHMYINTSFKYHRVTYTQSCVITKVHDLLGQPSYTLDKPLVGINVPAHWRLVLIALLTSKGTCTVFADIVMFTAIRFVILPVGEYFVRCKARLSINYNQVTC